MKVLVKQLSIRKLLTLKEKIYLNPRYQRGESWSKKKQELFIDSILLGFDIPKFFFYKSTSDALHSYDVIDGQQRLRALFKFVTEKASSTPLTLLKSHGLEWQDSECLTFSKMSLKDRTNFLKYKITVSIFSDISNDHLRKLFLRLQMGSTLNQAELRNAIASPMGDHICNIAENHPFFSDCTITNRRFKRQDYLAQAVYLTTCARGYRIKSDLTATNLYDMYNNSSKFSTVDWKKIYDVLDEMHKLVKHTHSLFDKKWMFIDFFLVLWLNGSWNSNLGLNSIARNIKALDEKRTEFKNDIETINEITEQETRLFISYVNAFYKDGNRASEITKRIEFLRSRKDIFLCQQN